MSELFGFLDIFYPPKSACLGANAIKQPSVRKSRTGHLTDIAYKARQRVQHRSSARIFARTCGS
jgi:hypothetical protein